METVIPGALPSAVLAALPAWGAPVAWLAAIFVLIVLGQGFGEYAQRLAFARFAIGLVHGGRAASVATLSKHPERFGRSSRAGDVIARVIGDSARVKAGLKGVLVHVAQNGVFFVGVCVLLLLVDLPLGTIFLVSGAAVTAVTLIGTAKVAASARRHRKKEGALANSIHGALVLKASTRRSADKATRTNRTSGYADAEITRLQGLTTWAIHAVLAVSTCGIVIVGVQRVAADLLSSGDLFTFLAYILVVHNPLVRLGRQVTRLGPILASAERLAEVLKRGQKRRKPRLEPRASRAAGTADVPIHRDVPA